MHTIASDFEIIESARTARRSRALAFAVSRRNDELLHELALSLCMMPREQAGHVLFACERQITFNERYRLWAALTHAALRLESAEGSFLEQELQVGVDHRSSVQTV